MEHNDQVMKSLTTLIDETLAELEALRKSDRFSASEIKLEGPGSPLEGAPTNGKLDKEEDPVDDKEDDEDDEDEEDEDKKDKDEVDKAEHPDLAEDKKHFAAKDHKHDIKCEVVKEEKDMGYPAGTIATKKSMESDDDLKKTQQETEKLMKSMLEEALSPLRAQIEEIRTSLKTLADTPVPAKGARHFTVTPLAKSTEAEPLNKSVILDKLLQLQKSGSGVRTEDVIRAELGGQAELADIAAKYNLK